MIPRLSYITSKSDAHRAPINMIHDNTALTVSEREATSIEEEAKRRLIGSRKLSLVVDLDQTIIHATVDPTVGEWQRDSSNPNHEAVKDVRAFQLVDEGAGMRGAWYYIKLRPGLKDFLEMVSQLYELHIYTMGTRAYAQHIAEIVDPERKTFGDRILSRDESGSLVAKDLQRLFPVDTKMVVIIDDRGDVWKWNDNLIRVTPYDFFVGIGDINSSFLPKKPTIMTTTTTKSPELSTLTAASAEVSKDNENMVNSSKAEAMPNDATASTLEQLVSMAGGYDPDVLQSQKSLRDEAIATQQKERPLLQKQLQLDAEDDAASGMADETGSPPSTDHEKTIHHHNLLQDRDTELQYLEQSLQKVHHDFFERYEQQLASTMGGRVGALRGSSSSKRAAPSNLDLELVPDVKTIMPAIKRRVLAGVMLVFSGVIPLGVDTQSSDIAFWARSFGAIVQDKISIKRSSRTTHIIAARSRTAKVRQAIRYNVKVVGIQWLMDSIVRWERQDETPYLLKTEEIEAHKARPIEADHEILSESESPASAPDTDTDATEAEKVSRPRSALRLNLGVNKFHTASGNATEDEELEIAQPKLHDPQSPVGGTNEDWRHMHDELEDFLGSEAGDDDDDDDDDDNQSESPATDTESSQESVRRGKRASAGVKRSHGQMNGPDGNNNDDDNHEQRRKLSKGTPLSQSQNQIHVSDSGLPTPDLTAEENGEGAVVNGEKDLFNDDDDDDDFQAEMEAALLEAEAEE